MLANYRANCRSNKNDASIMINSSIDVRICNRVFITVRVSAHYFRPLSLELWYSHVAFCCRKS